MGEEEKLKAFIYFFSPSRDVFMLFIRTRVRSPPPSCPWCAQLPPPFLACLTFPSLPPSLPPAQPAAQWRPRGKEEGSE